jgi:hypothetical protein
MNKSQDRSIWKKEDRRIQPQKINNLTTDNLVNSEGYESSIAQVRRMMIRIFNKLKEDIQKQLNEPQGNMCLRK